MCIEYTPTPMLAKRAQSTPVPAHDTLKKVKFDRNEKEIEDIEHAETSEPNVIHSTFLIRCFGTALIQCSDRQAKINAIHAVVAKTTPSQWMNPKSRDTIKALFNHWLKDVDYLRLADGVENETSLVIRLKARHSSLSCNAYGYARLVVHIQDKMDSLTLLKDCLHRMAIAQPLVVKHYGILIGKTALTVVCGDCAHLLMAKPIYLFSKDKKLVSQGVSFLVDFMSNLLPQLKEVQHFEYHGCGPTWHLYQYGQRLEEFMIGDKEYLALTDWEVASPDLHSKRTASCFVMSHNDGSDRNHVYFLKHSFTKSIGIELRYQNVDKELKTKFIQVGAEFQAIQDELGYLGPPLIMATTWYVADVMRTDDEVPMASWSTPTVKSFNDTKRYDASPSDLDSTLGELVLFAAGEPFLVALVSSKEPHILGARTLRAILFQMTIDAELFGVIQTDISYANFLLWPNHLGARLTDYEYLQLSGISGPRCFSGTSTFLAQEVLDESCKGNSDFGRTVQHEKESLYWCAFFLPLEFPNSSEVREKVKEQEPPNMTHRVQPANKKGPKVPIENNIRWTNLEAAYHAVSAQSIMTKRAAFLTDMDANYPDLNEKYAGYRQFVVDSTKIFFPSAADSEAQVTEKFMMDLDKFIGSEEYGLTHLTTTRNRLVVHANVSDA